MLWKMSLSRQLLKYVTSQRSLAPGRTFHDQDRHYHNHIPIRWLGSLNLLTISRGKPPRSDSHDGPLPVFSCLYHNGHKAFFYLHFPAGLDIW
jgi:hypothetical protein